MFVDVSALTAMMLDEDEARLLAARLQGATTRMTSPIAAFEAACRLTAALGLEPAAAEAAVRRFLDLMGIRTVSLPAQIVPLAMEAFARFGGHQAGALDAGRCLAYAAARYYRLPLLHRDTAFAATDIETG